MSEDGAADKGRGDWLAEESQGGERGSRRRRGRRNAARVDEFKQRLADARKGRKSTNRGAARLNLNESGNIQLREHPMVALLGWISLLCLIVGTVVMGWFWVSGYLLRSREELAAEAAESSGWQPTPAVLMREGFKDLEEVRLAPSRDRTHYFAPSSTPKVVEKMQFILQLMASPVQSAPATYLPYLEEIGMLDSQAGGLEYLWCFYWVKIVGDLELGREAALRSIAKNEALVASRVLISEALDQRGEWQEALEWLQPALDLDPANAALVVGVSNHLRHLDRNSEALALLEALLPSARRDLVVLGKLQLSRLQAGRTDEVRSWLENAGDPMRNPALDGWIRAALALDGGKSEDAAAELRTLRQFLPAVTFKGFLRDPFFWSYRDDPVLRTFFQELEPGN